MAVIYVDSASGSNTSPYETEAKAATSMQTALDQYSATGDEILVLDSHTESPGVNLTHTATNDSLSARIPLYRIATGGAYNPTSGADTKQINLNTSGNDYTMTLSAHYHGLFIYIDDNITSNQTGYSMEFTDCFFELATSNSQWTIYAANGDIAARFNRGQINFSHAGGGVMIIGNGLVEFNSVVFAGNAHANGLFRPQASRYTIAKFIGCDFSAIGTGTIIDSSNAADMPFCFHFINCDLDTTNITDGTFTTDQQTVIVENTDTAGGLYENAKYGFRGEVLTDTGVYYSGTDGYTDEDGSQVLSMKMSPASVVDLASPLESLPIIARIDSTGSKTFTVECVENFTTALTKREAWIEVEYLGASGEVDFSVADDREFAESSYTNLASGSGLGDWTAEPSGSRTVKLTATATVNQTGLYRVRVFVAEYESGKVLHYNPAVTVT
jgi:hypothetical protein